MQALLDNPIVLIVAGVVLLGLLMAALVVSRRKTAAARGAEGNIDKALASGKYGEAAALALAVGRVDEAIDYYMRGQQPLTAAQVAARAGKARVAAEAFERGEDFEQSARWYAKAGMQDKATEMRRRVPVAPQARLPEPALAPSTAVATLPAGEAPLRDDAPAPEPEPDAADNSPSARAVRLERAFRAKLRSADAGELGALGAEAAEALLSVGMIRNAADVYRDAELIDEAIHLYVNLLGAPGEAAPLVAKHGNHERAAELYELAGMKERAAAAWSTVGTASAHPETFYQRIDALSREVALRFLEENVGARPLASDTAELHYLYGQALEDRGADERALQVFVRIETALGEFKDVGERVVRLRAGDGGAGANAARDGRTKPSAGVDPKASRQARADLVAEEVAALATEAVKAALERVERGDALRPVPVAATLRSRPARTAETRAAGLEAVPIALELVTDASVQRAREGPSVESLWRLIGQRECDLQNIEVYYRLGLAYVSAGQWRDALRAFDAVEEASPGYRDAEQRAMEIRGWIEAHGEKHLTLGAAGGPATKGAPPTAPDGGAAGRYLIQGELGRGGMAVVYRAVDNLLARDVALKFIAEELGVSPQIRELFQREARSAAQLNHPNVVTVYDFGVIEGRLFIAMEYLEGTTVEQMIDQGVLSVVESLRIAVQVLAALEYAHARQLVHRDVKPSNMIRTSLGLVKLMDFGLAKSVAQGAKASLIAGTPAYMPPEQFTGGLVDQRADLFAVGASLFEMLTTKLPFEGTARVTPAPLVRALAPQLPAVLDELVARALALDPAERWQSAAEFAAPLRDILTAVEQAAGSAKPVPGVALTQSQVRTLHSPLPPGPAAPAVGSAASKARTEPVDARGATIPSRPPAAARATWRSEPPPAVTSKPSGAPDKGTWKSR